MKCAKDKCNLEATHAPQVCIPAKGHPQIEANSLKTIVNIQLCQNHAAWFAIKDIVRESDFQEAASYILQVMYDGRAVPLDFKRAWSVPVSITSSEFLSFEAQQATKQ